MSAMEMVDMDMVDMYMVGMEMVGMDMVDMDMVDMDMVDMDMGHGKFTVNVPEKRYIHVGKNIDIAKGSPAKYNSMCI